MGFTGGVLLVAIGAIMRFAVDAQTNGLDIQLIGVILMIAGAALILLSLAFWASWGGYHHRETVEEGPRTRRRIVDEY